MCVYYYCSYPALYIYYVLDYNNHINQKKTRWNYERINYRKYKIFSFNPCCLNEWLKVICEMKREVCSSYNWDQQFTNLTLKPFQLDLKWNKTIWFLIKKSHWNKQAEILRLEKSNFPKKVEMISWRIDNGNLTSYSFRAYL